MKKLLAIGAVLFLFSCGSGDTGEGYSDTTNAQNPAVGPTDSVTSATTGDRVNPNANSQADAYDERHRQDANNSPNMNNANNNNNAQGNPNNTNNTNTNNTGGNR